MRRLNVNYLNVPKTIDKQSKNPSDENKPNEKIYKEITAFGFDDFAERPIFVPSKQSIFYLRLQLSNVWSFPPHQRVLVCILFVFVFVLSVTIHIVSNAKQYTVSSESHDEMQTVVYTLIIAYRWNGFLNESPKCLCIQMSIALNFREIDQTIWPQRILNRCAKFIVDARTYVRDTFIETKCSNDIFFLITDVLKYQISTSGVSNLFSRLVQTMHLFWIQFLNRSSVLYFGQSVYSIWERTIWWGNNFHKCPWMLSVHNFRFSLFSFCDLKSKHVQHFKCAQIRYKLHFERFV